MEKICSFMYDILRQSDIAEKAVIQRGECLKFVEGTQVYCLKQEWEEYQNHAGTPVKFRRTPCYPEQCDAEVTDSVHELKGGFYGKRRYDG